MVESMTSLERVMINRNHSTRTYNQKGPIVHGSKSSTAQAKRVGDRMAEL